MLQSKRNAHVTAGISTFTFLFTSKKIGRFQKLGNCKAKRYMLFYNTILKTIRVSTSYNSYFGLMRQMYKKNIIPAK